MQVAWNTPNVIGHSRDPYTKKVDVTEGFGAFDSILKSYSLGIRTIDIGGGEHDFNSAYCQYKYGIDHVIYDPFMRKLQENEKVMAIAKERPFDTCVSISVLNVIDQPVARKEHIELCRSVIKQNGKAFFKVWPGNSTGIPLEKKGNFQSNRSLKSYFEEVSEVFARVQYDEENQIIVATKD